MHLISLRLNITIRTSTVCHLIAVKLSAATFLTRNNCQCIWWHRHQMQFWQLHQNNRQRAFNCFTAECSMSDIIFNRQCIWWHRHQVQHVWHHIHLIIFLRHQEPLNGFHTHSFDQIFLKKSISHLHFNRIIFISYAAYAISAKNYLRNKNSQSTFQQMIISTFYQMIISNGHFERSLHAVKTDQSSISFHFIYDQFFNFSIHFSSFFKFSDQGTTE